MRFSFPRFYAPKLAKKSSEPPFGAVLPAVRPKVLLAAFPALEGALTGADLFAPRDMPCGKDVVVEAGAGTDVIVMPP